MALGSLVYKKKSILLSKHPILEGFGINPGTKNILNPGITQKQWNPS
jgi:hypothetical protein